MSDKPIDPALTEALKQIVALQSRVADLEKEIAALKAAPRFTTFSPPLWTKPMPVIDVETFSPTIQPEPGPTSVPDPSLPYPAPTFGDDPSTASVFTYTQVMTKGKNIVDNQNEI